METEIAGAALADKCASLNLDPCSPANNFLIALFPTWYASSHERNRSVDSSTGRILFSEQISQVYRFGAGQRCFTSTRRGSVTDDLYILLHVAIALWAELEGNDGFNDLVPSSDGLILDDPIHLR